MFATRKQRFWFVIWMFWAIGWLLAYVFGAFYNAVKYGAQPGLIGFIENLKIGAFLFISVILPAVIVLMYKAFMRIKSWVGGVG